MKRIIFIILGCINICLAYAQSFNGQYISEWQWDMNRNTNLINQLRLELSVPIGKGKDSFEAATLHVAKTNDGIIDDWQGFSNIDADNNFAMLAVLGYMHEWNSGHLFVGVRNVNEDFFTSDVTALFQNSSEGIFPTVASSYPIANYPYSGLTLYFDVTKGKWTFRNSLYNGVGYNGWKAHDNPFLVRPKKDGIFNMSQLEYNDKGGKYFAGAAVHTRQYPINEDGEMVPADNPRARPPVPGGFTESRVYGRLATRTFRAWCSIPRTPVIRMPATDTPNWAAPIRTIRTSAACQASTPASSRVRNIHWK